MFGDLREGIARRDFVGVLELSRPAPLIVEQYLRSAYHVLGVCPPLWEEGCFAASPVRTGEWWCRCSVVGMYSRQRYYMSIRHIANSACSGVLDGTCWWKQDRRTPLMPFYNYKPEGECFDSFGTCEV